MLADVVLRKGVSAGSLDGWGWRELKVLPVSWYDGLARILSKVEDLGVWPEGLLDAYITMIPKADGDATPLGQRPLSVLPIVYRIWASALMGQLDGWFRSWYLILSSVLGVVVVRLRLGTLLLLILRRSFLVLRIPMSTFLLLMLSSPLTRRSLGLPGWFRHAYFEHHAHVRLRFKLASGLGQSWTQDGGISQGCPLSMIFIVALYLPWCRYLSAQVGVQPQLYADNLKCQSCNPDFAFTCC